MNKSILCLTFILISFVGLTQENDYLKPFIQDSAKDCIWANQIDRLVSPRYILMTFALSLCEEIKINGKDLLTDLTHIYQQPKQGFLSNT